MTTPADEAATEQPKTYKRELATLMLLFLSGLVVWGIYDVEAKEAGRFLTLPIFTFAGGAFGMDAWAKQLRS